MPSPSIPNVQEPTPENKDETLKQKLDKLYEKLSEKKKRDGWDKIQIIGPTLATVLVAAVGVYFTTTYNEKNYGLQTRSYELQDEIQNKQLQIQQAQLQIAQLKAVTDLTQYLTNKDPNVRAYADSALKIFIEADRIKRYHKQENPHTIKNTPSIPNSRINHEDDLSSMLVRLSNSVRINSPQASETAMKKMVAVIADSTKPTKERKAYFNAVNRLKDEDIPQGSKDIAINFIKKYKGFKTDEILNIISADTSKRLVSEIVLHHTATPSIASYRSSTFDKFADFQLNQMGWSGPGSHFTIAPDGLTYYGRELSKVPASIPTHNVGTVSVQLILDGDKELPTQAQKIALIKILNALCTKYKLSMEENFAMGRGFHRDYINDKPCPGKLITKDLLLSWNKEYK